MKIPQSLLDDLIAHARAEYDAECCGMVAYARADSDGEPVAGSEPVAGGELVAGNEPVAGSELVGDGDPVAVQVHRATNIFASRKRFEIDGREVLRAMNEFEDAGWELGAIYHSHTHTAPYPSQTDINFAANWPGLEWVIVGLAGEVPEVRCYLIEDGEVREVELHQVR